MKLNKTVVGKFWLLRGLQYNKVIHMRPCIGGGGGGGGEEGDNPWDLGYFEFGVTNVIVRDCRSTIPTALCWTTGLYSTD